MLIYVLFLKINSNIKISNVGNPKFQSRVRSTLPKFKTLTKFGAQLPPALAGVFLDKAKGFSQT